MWLRSEPDVGVIGPQLYRGGELGLGFLRFVECE